MVQHLWDLWLLVDEPIGTALGLIIVGCLIRQNVWAWSLGVAYVLVSITVLLEARLYANLALHLLGFLPMNLYGWYYWVFGKADVSTGQPTVVPVTYSSHRLIGSLLTLTVAGTLVLGTAFARYSDAALPYWDNALFVGSLAAMWLTARKKIENWAFWFAINIVSVGVYWSQGLPLYAGLYFVYLAMAIAGWRAWKRSMAPIVEPLASR
ncbi:MAG: nicotinamide riboside transporter PnuC [Pseudomonadales bacterium]